MTSTSDFLDDEQFARVLELETQRARRLQYCLSLVSVALDLPPGKENPILTKRWAELAAARLRATDLVVRSDPSRVVLVLIDAETSNLAGILGRLTGSIETCPRPIETDWPGFTVSAGGACYPRTVTDGSELLRQAVDLMARAQGDGGNRLYVGASGPLAGSSR